jgi:tetratricopeptide (TPR) repeat protein
MPILSAENNFKKGLVALVDDDPGRAVDFFRRALDIERDRKVRRPEWRYLSYYGLSLALSGDPGPRAIEACETAAAREGVRSDLYLNLGQVYMMADRVDRAREALQRGLELDPRSLPLIEELSRVCRRSRPPIGGLHRDHRVNRVLGSWRAHVKARAERPSAAANRAG